MFIMTSNIKIGKYTVKPSAVKWRRSVTNYIDACTISLPKIPYFKNSIEATDRAEFDRTFVFGEGDAVSVELGYDGRNALRFKGFVKVIDVGDKLEIQCEGYAYLLPKSFSKTYQNTTVKKILQDLTAGTSIKISEKTADISVPSARFKAATGRQVLEWMQQQLKANVFFDFDTIYAGFKYGLKNSEKPAKLRINWNVAEDKNFKKRIVDKNVQINLIEKNPSGEVKKIKSDEKKYSQIKEVKIKSGLNEAFLKAKANDLQKQQNYQGYQGTVTAFLEPVINPSDVVEIIDKTYPERQGLFFVEQVEGSFDQSGGRQVLTLNYFSDDGK